MGTKVSVDRSVEEIRRTAERYGAEGFTYGISPLGGVVQFKVGPRWVKFKVDKNEDEAEWRRRWRVLLISVKVRLERVADGDSSVDEEFFANVMLPDGSTVFERMREQVEAVYAGTMDVPMLALPSGGASRR